MKAQGSKVEETSLRGLLSRYQDYVRRAGSP